MWMVLRGVYKNRAILKFLKASGLFPISLIVSNTDILYFKKCIVV